MAPAPAGRDGGRIAPTSQKIGRKMPTTNITQWPLRRLRTPRVINSTKYRIASPMNIASPVVVDRLLKAVRWGGSAPHPTGMNRAANASPIWTPPAEGDSQRREPRQHEKR